MPSSSKSQYKLMQFASINKAFAEKKGIKQETAKEWHAADVAKKKEDPEWYENLPEKFEKKKKDDDSEPSTEGLSSLFSSLFHGKKENKELAHSHEINFRYDGKEMVKKTYLNEAWLDGKEFKTGPINIGDLSNKFNYPTIPSNLLDTTEKYIQLLGDYMIKYSTAVHRFASELADKWDEVKGHATPEEAQKAISTVFKKRTSVDNIPLPSHGLGNLGARSVQEHDEYSQYMKAQTNPGVRINFIPALTKDQVRKVGKLIDRVLDYVDKHDDLWDEERKNMFDYKTEWKRMKGQGKEPDDYVDAMNMAGFEGTMFDNDDIVRDVLLNAAKALDAIATRSMH